MAVIALGAACGGSVVFVEDDDGAGGSGGTTSSSKASGTVSTTKSGSAVTAVTTTDAVTTVVTSGVTTGTGGQFCEFGEANTQCADCIDESVNGPCQAAFNQCFGDFSCEQYSNCIGNCQGNGNCCQSCDSQFPPQVVAAYSNLLACVFCDTCAQQCAGVFPGFCGF